MNEQSFFESLSDETRRRLLSLLMQQGELCVCELFYALDMPQPKVSRHLGVLREAGLLAVRREGTWVYYRLQPQMPLWAYKILEAMVQGVEQAYREDVQRLETMSNRPLRCCA